VAVKAKVDGAISTTLADRQLLSPAIFHVESADFADFGIFERIIYILCAFFSATFKS